MLEDHHKSQRNAINAWFPPTTSGACMALNYRGIKCPHCSRRKHGYGTIVNSFFKDADGIPVK